jgi:hypothetical protein
MPWCLIHKNLKNSLPIDMLLSAVLVVVQLSSEVLEGLTNYPVYYCLWRGLGGEGGTFWLHRATLTFKGPAANQATAVYLIGVKKISQNFDTLFVTSLEVFRLFKGLAARRV